MTPPSLSVSHCPACPLASINPKTRLGSPWSNQIPRRRKHPPAPLLDWQHLPIPALCPLSKARAPDPVPLPCPPTPSTMTTNVTGETRRARETPFQPRWRRVIHGTASPARPRLPPQTRPLVEGARRAQPAQGAARARNGRRLARHSHLRVTKVRKYQCHTFSTSSLSFISLIFDGKRSNLINTKLDVS